MNYKKLGNTDIKVSTICLGTMTWGEQNSPEEGFEQMDFALDQGVNFWDTAELYSVPPKEETFGHTEIIIGDWFQKTKKRDKVILATKVAGPARDYIRDGENSFGIKNMTIALNDSLKRLKTDYIDLYQLHWPMQLIKIDVVCFKSLKTIVKCNSHIFYSKTIFSISNIISSRSSNFCCKNNFVSFFCFLKPIANYYFCMTKSFFFRRH